MDVDDEFTQTSEVARIITHERFNPVTLRYSIALFRMKTPFVFNEFVSPICVPDDGVADHKYESCHITGYNAQPGGELTMQVYIFIYLLYLYHILIYVIIYCIYQMMLAYCKKQMCI